jgi:hypothetical protein
MGLRVAGRVALSSQAMKGASCHSLFPVRRVAASCLSMIFSENRYTLFGIMLDGASNGKATYDRALNDGEGNSNWSRQ